MQNFSWEKLITSPFHAVPGQICILWWILTSSFLRLFSPFSLINFVYCFVCMMESVCTTHLWRSEENFEELILCLHLVGPRDWTQVIWLVAGAFTPQIFSMNGVLLVHVYVPCQVHHVHAVPIKRPKEGIGSSTTPVSDDPEPPCQGWELNSNPLEKQPVPITAELSL